MKKIFSILVIVLVLVLGAGVGFGVISSKNSDKPSDVLSYQTTIKNNADTTSSNSEQIPLGNPVTLRIPAINVETTIESKGLDEKKAMDVPDAAENVAWYNLGPKPGQVGSSVLAGHYDRVDGSPAVFWDLPKLSIGDEISVEDDAGNIMRYEVTEVQQYPYDDFPIERVFNPKGDAMLNLITCQGEWNDETKNYGERMVVYSRLITE